jgi:hypothetical protein
MHVFDSEDVSREVMEFTETAQVFGLMTPAGLVW